jgi:16S rRNA (guanine527-N7)-methyltransferase
VPERTEVEQLRCGAAGLELELSVDQAQRLVDYAQLLVRWNEKFNLVSRRDVGRLLSRHLLDSLSICPWLHGERVLDIGSGAGLPGVPLAMVNAGRRFTLVDRSERKARFLEQVVMTFDLDNVEVQCADAAALETEPGFTTIVCRAVAGLPKMWQMSQPLLAAGGRLVFMNRTVPESEAQSEAGGCNAKEERDQRVGLPSGLSIVGHRVHIPGLPNPHEVLIVEAPP